MYTDVDMCAHTCRLLGDLSSSPEDGEERTGLEYKRMFAILGLCTELLTSWRLSFLICQLGHTPELYLNITAVRST